MTFIIDDLLKLPGDLAKADAAKDAQAQNAELIQSGRDATTGAAYTANNLLNDAMPATQDLLGQGYGGAIDFLTQGYGGQRSDLLQGGQLGAGAITQGMGGGLDALYGGAGQGVGYVNSGLESGVGAIGGRTDRAGQMLDQAGGLYGNYQADPGYQFRLQQGEQALRNMQAAQGGRFGGAAMKALVDYNQNAASQEFGNYANRANSEYGARSAADAQSLSAANSLAGLYGGAANQAAGMVYGAGQGAANIYGQGGSQLAGLYGDIGAQLGNASATAGATLGGATQDYYGSLANLNQGLASQEGQNLIGAAQSNMGTIPAAIDNNNSTIAYNGLGWDSVANGVQGLGNAAVYLGASALQGK